MIFYIDTTSNYLYTALVSNEKVIAEVKEKLDSDLSVYALPRISSMFEKNNISPDEVSKIIVVNGPGSFTGIRIGVTIAKIYAWALKKDINTITSLEAMALSSTNNTKYKIPMIDARRGYVFAGIYDQNNNQVLKNNYINIESLKSIAKDLPGDYTWISNSEINTVNIEPYNPDIYKICMKYKDKESVNPHMVNPEYFKLTEAEENMDKSKNDRKTDE